MNTNTTENLPQGKHPRVEVADVLRGIAVMAIILLHSIEHFNFYSFPDTTNQSAWLNFTDRCIWDGLFFLIGGKAYAIFALLFGFSFFVQDYNRRIKGFDFRARFSWRLVILFIIGNFNAMFFTGEILVLYSLVGFVLVLTCRLSTKALLWIAGICLIQPWSVVCAIISACNPDFVVPALKEGPLWAATMAEQSTGSFWSTAKVNLWQGQIVSLYWAVNNGRVFQTAALFIFGMLIGRQGYFQEKHLMFWAKVCGIALFTFFPLYGLYNMMPNHITNPQLLGQLKIIIGSLYKFCFMLVLVCWILFWYYRTSFKSIMVKIIPYGKMSMTNYVTQGIIGSFLFYNWGLGLYKYLGITASLCVGIAIFLIQLAWSKWWTRRYAHGPFEGVWKKLTWIGSDKK